MFFEHEGMFRRGVEEFNARRFFEAHEVWEELWRELSGPDRIFVQALIQTAAGLYHLTCDNERGAASQLEKALEKLHRYLPAYHGINTLHLADAVRHCREQIGVNRECPGMQRTAVLPTIELQQ